MTVTHIVLFQFKPTVSLEKVQDVRILQFSPESFVRGNDIPTEGSPPLLKLRNQLSSILLTWELFQVCNRMLSLKQDCIHPTTQKPYILESSGGKDHSSEGHQVG